MLILQLAVTAALILALVALVTWRRAVLRLERLAESYWELRYEVGQLRSRVDRLEGVTNGAAEPAPAAAPASFVPLSSLKR